MNQLDDFARRYAAAWCSQEPDRVAAFFSETGSLSVNEGAPAVGREAISAVAQGFMTAFPDIRVSMDRLEQQAEALIFHWTLTGTNTGPGGRGKSVNISGYEIWQLADDGLIAESKGHFDAAEYEHQLVHGFGV